MLYLLWGIGDESNMTRFSFLKSFQGEDDSFWKENQLVEATREVSGTIWPPTTLLE